MSTSPRRVLPAQVRRRDILRLSLQSAIAGTAAFAISRWAGTGEAFLAIISAVLVLQTDWDATVGKAGWRVAGAIAGTVIGIAALAVSGGGSLLPLAAAMFVMGGLAAWHPKLSYGLVAAAGLSVGSDASFLDTAQQRTLAIVIGTATGILAGLVVWPERAGARASRHLRIALGRCRDLLEDSLKTALDEDEGCEDLGKRHRGLEAALGAARDTAEAMTLDHHGRRQGHLDAVHAAERLWHALIILNRVVETKRSERLPMRDPTLDRLDRIRSAACQAISCAARLERISQEDLETIRETNESIWREADIDPDTTDELQSVALLFGIDEIKRNLCELDAAIGAIANDR